MNFRWIAGRLRPALLSTMVGAALLTACGGGSSTYQTFVPNRMFVFGDETSYIGPNGQKYSINGFTTTTSPTGATTSTASCAALPNWVQSLAAMYGFVFAQCNPNPGGPTLAYMYAFPGAYAGDVEAQIDTQVANGGFQQNDLATILAGANDIIYDYKQYPQRTEADLEADLGTRGQLLGQQVNRLLALGVKVILSTSIDMGTTPYARAEQAANIDTDRAALLSRMTAAFNEQLGVTITIDGSLVGLVQADQRSEAMAQSPGSFGLANVSQGACLATSPPPTCTSATLVPGATPTNYMWADSLNAGAALQAQLGSLAVARARGNPF